MGNPNVEMALIGSRLNEDIRALVFKARDILLAGRADGTPDRQIIQNILAGQVLKPDGKPEVPTDPIIGQKKRIVNNIQGRLGSIYTEASARLGAALDRPIPFDGILPTQEGYVIPKDFNDPVDRALARAQVKAERRAEEFNREVVNNQGEVHLIWVAAMVKTCKDCIRLSGQTKTFDEWKRSGFFPRNGNTVCKEFCQCHLAPAREMAERFKLIQRDASGNLLPESRVEEKLGEMFKNGVKLQNLKIDELERIRGEKYALTTRTQMLGEIRTDKFNRGFKKKEAVFLKKVPKNKPRKFIKQSEDLTFRT